MEIGRLGGCGACHRTARREQLYGTGQPDWLALPVGGSYATDVLAPVLLTTLGVGMGFVPITTASIEGVEPAAFGVATGLLKTSQQVGSTIGLAALATLTTATAARSTGVTAVAAAADGCRVALLVAALVLVEIRTALVMPRLAAPESTRVETLLHPGIQRLPHDIGAGHP